MPLALVKGYVPTNSVSSRWISMFRWSLGGHEYLVVLYTFLLWKSFVHIYTVKFFYDDFANLP